MLTSPLSFDIVKNALQEIKMPQSIDSVRLPINNSVSFLPSFLLNLTAAYSTAVPYMRCMRVFERFEWTSVL